MLPSAAIRSALFLLTLFPVQIISQNTPLILTGTLDLSSMHDGLPTETSGLYKTYETTSTLTGSETEVTDTKTPSITDSDALMTSSPTANGTTLSGNVTSTSTSNSAPPPQNTRPCNGYAEFCARNYTNITQVAAHNSPFVRQGNLGANQALPVKIQLNDGIRMLQFQAHHQNDTMLLCHTTCDLLNAGPLEDYLVQVTEWIKENPYDVVTIIIGNYDLVAPGNFTEPIKNSGLIDYVYIPPKIPMGLDDWPTMSELILSHRRAIVFMDYMANQTDVPYILDEFSQMWETPFSPTDRDFPCTVQRPPGLNDADARNRMYLANHNLNTEVNLLGASLLVPNIALLNETNAVSGYGSIGTMGKECTENWGRPPNFLLVDYYNMGSFNGSVFQVAADLNNVEYNGHCCGTNTSWAADGLFLKLAESRVQRYIALLTTILMIIGLS